MRDHHRLILLPFAVSSLLLLSEHFFISAFTSTASCAAGNHRHNTKVFSSASTADDFKTNEKLRIVVVGGGWAGYSFAESISYNNIEEKHVDIILLDAAKQAKGGLAGGFRDGSSNNRPVEAGIHGFWREYKNTFDIMNQIEGVAVDEVLGEYTPSVLFSKNGKVAVAPVLVQDDGSKDNNNNSSMKLPKLTELNEQAIRRLIAANLPPPLDLPVLAELNGSKTKGVIQPTDLLSGLGLLGAWADFEQESPSSWKRYDSQPASLLFEKAGVTDTLFEELVSPLLHVLPMCPAYDCSAAAALSCFHVFALQSRGAFDARWCKGSISEKIFEPWQDQLVKRNVSIRGGARVSSIEKNESGKYTVSLDTASEDEVGDTIECDAVVLAVGATAAGRLAASSPALSSLPATKDFDKLRGVTCVAVRLFLRPSGSISSNLRGGAHSKSQLPSDMTNAMVDSPIAVCGAGIGNIEELGEAGFCIYDLQRMHDEWSANYYDSNNVPAEEQLAVIEVDFFRADKFVDLDDDGIVDLALRAISKALGTTKIDQSDIVFNTVLRARNAVSHFAPSSASYSPDVKLEKGVYFCGDWIDRTGHASWSTEKSVVTARQAASELSTDFGLTRSRNEVIPAATDTPQLSTLRKLARLLRSYKPPSSLPPSPWVYAKQLLSGQFDP
mmetsp:Transcript_21327/g.30541  ORF Transcript_21327/g.30541 Transcript_21327/m.30541 type:complete len:669 (+) Transcript_21327:165-2171(+)|eukprot:CAMPEP_0201698934 /NCGR_PEP_ID=MMETSP0578-20130828/21554_1 /ASSEMBLY_ACC=CAM_ASM_000663 /TAXON_ID=267565 /ORGANISM="Skeletonema grethea, Strain CCMP 1804" /LENGTH=668 /DNA_ID=CAMNT_0048185583 /DNA_START=56 /DNA_END=2062 /DNA_ORIENTATION=-